MAVGLKGKINSKTGRLKFTYKKANIVNIFTFSTTSAVETLVSYSSSSAVWDTGYSADNSLLNFTTTSAVETLISYSSASALLSA